MRKLRKNEDDASKKQGGAMKPATQRQKEGAILTKDHANSETLNHLFDRPQIYEVKTCN